MFRIDRYSIRGGLDTFWWFLMQVFRILTEYDEISRSSISRLSSRSIDTRRTKPSVHTRIWSSIADHHICYLQIVGFAVWMFDLVSDPIRMSCEEVLIADQLRCRTWCPFPPLDPSTGSRLQGAVEGRIFSSVHCSVDGPCLENSWWDCFDFESWIFDINLGWFQIKLRVWWQWAVDSLRRGS